MIGLLRFIFIFFLVIFLLGYISRILLHFFFKRMNKKYGGGQSHEQRPEGDVKVNQTRSAGKRVSKDVGDYIEYEEVKYNKK